MATKVLLFDIDGTLIDAGGAGQAAMEGALSQLFGANQPVTGIPTAGRTDRAIAVDLFEFHQLEMNDGHWSQYLETYFRLLPESLATNPGSILPGVVTLLEQLSERDDVLLGLLTGNFANGAQLKLAHFEWGGFGDQHVNRDDVARTAFDVAKSKLPQLKPHDVWVIGDTPADVRCGRAIGANVLSVATGIYREDELRPHAPDLLLKDLSQPDEWLSAF